ncbi:ArsC family reductase [Emcibacter nanhaiensis]|uniref:ArsC family reductase n=1 Tax=Emcibacter nanhaiensis TaxID=1505037 RepID=A0A501PBC6_9PROT|nr:ArsC family reductase [Emcibacter nanhaiensis]TPD57498.1 ArsC family reductase [Emcibacter nanhaiensis]
MITVYGIKNCDTIKKALKWLEEKGQEFQFHDYRKDGIEETWLRERVAELGWENLLNRRGTTWRKLPDEVKNSVDEEQAIRLMIEQPAMIKRPLFDLGTERRLGFSKKDQEQLEALLSA